MRKGDAVRVIESIEAIRAIFDKRVIKQLGYALGQDLADYFEAVTGALENLQIAVQNRVTQPMEERSCVTCTKSKALGAPGKGRTCVADRLCVEFGEWVPRPTRGEPPETRLTGESPTRDEVPAVGAQAARNQASKGCWACKHRRVREDGEPCLSCTWEPDNQYSRHEPVTPASK